MPGLNYRRKLLVKTKEKLIESIDDLEKGLQSGKKALNDRFSFAAISKLYEVCLEYAWKRFKEIAIREGFEVYSPREAIKMAGRLNLIDNVEQWLNFLENRNIAVHDYLGISRAEYLKSIRTFLIELKKITEKI